MALLVSAVVPVFNDSDAAAALLAGVRPDSRVEIILADGGVDPALDQLTAERPDTTVVRSDRGRGTQMNAGAARARAPWLLFLHADSQLPGDWLGHVAALPPAIVGGWFRFALDDSAWQARLIEWGVTWRVRLLKLPYGDQGFFVRRDVFERMGGYRDVPLMEDVDFIRRLRRMGRCAEIPLALTTSARRWRRDGWWRRTAANGALIALYFAGVSPSTLARWSR